VRYEQVNAMLHNEFLKAHRKMQEQQATIATSKSRLTLSPRLSKRVSAHLTAASPCDGGREASKFATGRIRGGGPAPKTVAKTRADCGATGYRPFARYLIGATLAG
jgi:hypothetical protein